ncbi:MAG TPA: hypothetical protein VN277_05175, partial [Acidiferrobacterales bacterium]|nr:hypothetical protein [Acidiferrobacterales bacterium]
VLQSAGVASARSALGVRIARLLNIQMIVTLLAATATLSLPVCGSVWVHGIEFSTGNASPYEGSAC